MATWTAQQRESIHRMLNPSSIAVVGATSRLQYGGRFLRSSLQAGSRVRVYPVNPNYEELMGVRCYPDVAALPESPDVVGIIVPYHQVMGVLQQCAEKGAASAIVISAGFAERGDRERHDLQREIGDFARRSGVRVCGPNCLGVANLKANIWASSAAPNTRALTGPIALVSHSGASAFGPFLSRAVDMGIGYSYIISTGNEADLESSDFIHYLLDDPDTRVIACFVEGFKDGRKFKEVSELALARGKPIVLIKIGRSATGAKAALSHTAALTGSDAVHDALFKQYGVVRVEDYDDLLQTAQLLAFSPAPKKEGIAVVSHSGGISSMIADKCGQVGLELPPLAQETKEGLDAILQGFGWAANPADVTGLANREEFSPILELMAQDPAAGLLVVASAGGESQAQQVIALRQHTDKPIAFLWTSSPSETDGLDKLKEARIPLFYSPEKLARSLRGLVEYHRRAHHTKAEGPLCGAPAPVSRGVGSGLLPPGRQAFTERQAKALLAGWGISVTREQPAAGLNEALGAARQIGYPVAMKIDSPDILHKSEVGGVKLGIRDKGELLVAYKELMENVRRHAPKAHIEGVLVQEMVTGGVEVIVGLSQDPQFGAVLLFGLGGVFVEVFNDVALRLCPITEREAQEMQREVRGAPLLQGFRGRPPSDVDALTRVLLQVSQLASDLADRGPELDINPLAVLPRGQGVKALDARVVLAR